MSTLRLYPSSLQATFYVEQWETILSITAGSLGNATWNQNNGTCKRNKFVPILLTDLRNMCKWCMPSSRGGFDITLLFSYSDADPGSGDSSDEKHNSVLMGVVRFFFRGATIFKLLRDLFILTKNTRKLCWKKDGKYRSTLVVSFHYISRHT